MDPVCSLNTILIDLDFSNLVGGVSQNHGSWMAAVRYEDGHRFLRNLNLGRHIYGGGGLEGLAYNC